MQKEKKRRRRRRKAALKEAGFFLYKWVSLLLKRRKLQCSNSVRLSSAVRQSVSQSVRQSKELHLIPLPDD